MTLAIFLSLLAIEVTCLSLALWIKRISADDTKRFESLYKEFHGLNLYVRGTLRGVTEDNTKFVRTLSKKGRERGFTTTERVKDGMCTRGEAKKED